MFQRKNLCSKSKLELNARGFAKCEGNLGECKHLPVVAGMDRNKIR